MPKPREEQSDRRRWTEADARVALDALARSGLSVRKFAIREGLNEKKLFWWRRILQKAVLLAPPAPPTPKFVEIQHVPATQLEVVLLGGRLLRFPATLDVGVLQRVATALENDSKC